MAKSENITLYESTEIVEASNASTLMAPIILVDRHSSVRMRWTRVVVSHDLRRKTCSVQRDQTTLKDIMKKKSRRSQHHSDKSLICYHKK